MITRDYILRQVQQMVAALAQVVLKRDAEEYHLAKDIVSRSIQEITDSALDKVRRMSEEELTDICSQQGVFYSEKAIALADLLREDGFLQDSTGNYDAATDSWTRSVWLYEKASGSGGIVPINLQDRLDELRTLLHSHG